MMKFEERKVRSDMAHLKPSDTVQLYMKYNLHNTSDQIIMYGFHSFGLKYVYSYTTFILN